MEKGGEAAGAISFQSGILSEERGCVPCACVSTNVSESRRRGNRVKRGVGKKGEEGRESR